MIWRTLLIVASIWLHGRACARVQARVPLARARGQHIGLDAQRKQVLPEVVVNLPCDALAFVLLDVFRMRAEPAQVLVRQLQLGLAGPQLLWSCSWPARRHVRRDELSVMEQDVQQHGADEAGQHRQPWDVGDRTRCRGRTLRTLKLRFPQRACCSRLAMSVTKVALSGLAAAADGIADRGQAVEQYAWRRWRRYRREHARPVGPMSVKVRRTSRTGISSSTPSISLLDGETDADTAR